MSIRCSSDLAVKITKAHALDLHGGGVPKPDGATYVGVQVREELMPPGHVVRGARVEVPAIDPVVVRAVAEDLGTWLVEVE